VPIIWREEALAQKLGIIRQTVNTWISDIRARQKAGLNVVIIRLSRLAWAQERIAEVVKSMIYRPCGYYTVHTSSIQDKNLPHYNLFDFIKLKYIKTKWDNGLRLKRARYKSVPQLRPLLSKKDDHFV